MPRPQHCAPWTRENSGNITICCMRIKPAKIRVISPLRDWQRLPNHWVSIQASSILAFNSGKYKDQVLQDKAEGTALGVNSTPSFAIDGKLVVIQQSYNELNTALDAAIAAKAK